MCENFDYEGQAAPIRAAAAERFPEEFMENNRQLTANLERDVVANALDVGDTAPDFALHQAGSDADRSLSDALAKGPVVLSFYRGQW